MKGPSACDACLRRADLLGFLAPYVTRALAGARRVPALLALDDERLIAAVAGKGARAAHKRHAAFRPESARAKAVEVHAAPVCRHDDAFPSRLLDAEDAARMLYVRGDAARLRWLAEPAVTVVGARRCSGYGQEVARELGYQLAAAGLAVVSGMALGIDSAAHRGALEACGPTVAILASGVDTPYPRSKRALYQCLVRDGLVLSEFPPGFEPHRWCFPARNRIMAALGQMTVVVEAAERSGSLITADLARQMGRDVGAVPGQVTSSCSRGTNALLADGARLVRDARDVVEELFGPAAVGRLDRDPPEPDLEPALRALLTAVEQGEGSVDRLATSPADAAEVMAGLGRLESLGLVRMGPGGRYQPTAGSSRRAAPP